MSNARVSQHSSNSIDEPIPCVWKKADQKNGKILVTPDNHTWALNGKTSKKWFLSADSDRKPSVQPLLQ